MMRTTLNIPKDAYVVARSLADFKGISLGDAVGELIRQALKSPVGVDTRKRFPCFAVPEGSQPITMEQTLRAEDEL